MSLRAILPMMLRHFSLPFISKPLQLKLRSKVLLPVITIIVLTMGAALLIVNQVVRREVHRTISEELQHKIRIFDSLQRSQFELLVERTLVVANTPYLKAAMETGHPETVQRQADKIFADFQDYTIIILGREQQLLAFLSPDSNLDLKVFQPRQFSSSVEISGIKIGILTQNGSLFLATWAPVILPDRISGYFLVGYVLLATPVDSQRLDEFSATIGSQLMFFHQGRPAVSSSKLSSDLRQKIQREGIDPVEKTRIRTVLIGEEHYLVGFSEVELADRSGFLLIAPVESAFRTMIQPIERTIFSVAGFAVLAAILISLFISRQVVSPVQHLVQATEAVSAGNYDREIHVRTRDEIGDLARRFDQMRQSLKKQMNELAQRNRELEEALLKLEKTQHDLVQSEKLAATGRLTAQLSHELNNPIHNIRSCLEMARKKLSEGGDAGEYLNLAHDEIVRIGRLVQQMLDFYRPASQDKKLIDLQRLLHGIVQMTEPRLAKRHIRVIEDYAPDLPPLHASPDQLKQVFLNIITNAYDAMPQGGELRITTRRVNSGVEIEFSDTGIGIPQHRIRNIFDAFYTTKSRASGVGLGLSVSYGIIRSHGGKIIVESEEGRGATFIVQLPVDESTKKHLST